MHLGKCSTFYLSLLIIINIIGICNSYALVQWTFNLTEYSFTLYTNAPSQLNYTLLDCTKFTFANSWSAVFSLSGCGSTVLISPIIITIHLTPSDATTIQLNRNFSAGASGTYYLRVAQQNYLVSGVESLDIIGAPGRLASDVTPDAVQPTLSTNGFFFFDLNTGTFQLSFSKPIDIQTWSARPITPGALVFQSFLTASSPEEIFSVQQLMCPKCTDGTNLTFAFPQSELNRLKLTPRVCSSIAVCWLTFPAPGRFVQDVWGNNNSLIPNGQLSISRLPLTFIYDTNGPLLLSFALNLNLQTLTLTFDEPVDPTSLNISGIALQSGMNTYSPRQLYRLQTSSTQSTQSNILLIQISTLDYNEILSRSTIGLGISSTFLSLSSNSVVDVTSQRNPNQAILSTNALQATIFSPITSPPLITAFDLDLDSGSITLTFNRPVLVGAVNPAFLTLIIASSTYNITGGITQPTLYNASAVIAVLYSSSDDIEIQLLYAAAQNAANAYLLARSGAAFDTFYNPSISISSPFPLLVTTLTPNTSPPLLLSFALDMNTGIITLMFSDPVNMTTLDATSLVLQSTVTRVTGQWYGLTSSSNSAQSLIPTSIIVSLSVFDLNHIKKIRPLAKSITSTYLAATSSLVKGLNGVGIIDVTNGNALPALLYIPDLSPPYLLSFALDMNAGHLVLTFTEVVDIQSLDISQLALQSSVLLNQTYRFTGVVDVVPSDSDSVFAIQLTQADLNMIKQNHTLATSISNTYLGIKSGAIRDMAYNFVVPIVLQASLFISDTTGPNIVSFSLDLNSNQLVLIFSESVDALSLNISGLSLINGIPRPTATWSLTSNAFFQTASTMIVISLSWYDISGIATSGLLATSVNTTFITALPTTVLDTSGNLLVPIESRAALQVSFFIHSTRPPLLLAFGLDMSHGALSMTFSGAIRGISFNPTQIKMQNSSSAVGGSNLNLTGGTWLPQNSLTLTFFLSPHDLNRVKAAMSSGLAKSLSSTYLSLTSATATDVFGSAIIPISSSAALQASYYVPDVVPPQLVQFSLDLTARNLYLTFDETVLTQTLSVEGIELQDDASIPKKSVYLHAMGSRISSSGYTGVIVGISISDFIDITAAFPLASSPSYTYITLDTNTIQDTSGNTNAVILPNSALSITNLTPDIQSPTLQSFTFDLNQGVISFTFSESINASTFQPSQITIQNSLSLPQFSFTLSGGTTVNHMGPVITLSLLHIDLNEIKAIGNLATQLDTTFIRITSMVVQDNYGNSVTPAVLQTITFIYDSTPPILLSFDFDLNVGALTLHFNEPVNLTAFNVAALTLSNAGMPNDRFYTLGNSSSASVGYFSVGTIQISSYDLNILKKFRICIAMCHLDTTSFLTSDKANNLNLAASLNASVFVRDTTPPQLERFVLFDWNTGIFSLQFTESVNASDIVPSQVAFYSNFTANSNSFTLSQLNALSQSDTAIIFQSGIDDWNGLKVSSNICYSRYQCWIRIGSEFLSDVSGNHIVPIIPNSMTMNQIPERIVVDTTSPVMVLFTIDMNIGLMTCKFSEVVNLLTFDATKLVLQDSPSATTYFQPNSSGSSVRSPDGLSVNWNIALEDFILIRANSALFKSLNTSWVTYSSLIKDVAGNLIVPHLFSSNALQAFSFTRDTTRPILSSFLAFDLNDGTLTLLYNKPVDLTSLKLTEIAITNNYTFSLSFYNQEVINSWYSVQFANGSIFNLTHLFNPKEYILSCPFSVQSPSPLLLRGCSIVLNHTLEEPFYFLTGGKASYGDREKQTIIITMNRADLKYLKLSTLIAFNDATTFVAFNSTALLDTSGNPVVPSSLFNATKLMGGAFKKDSSPPSLESFALDLNTGLLMLHFNDLVNVTSVVPFQCTFHLYPESNNTFTLQGEYTIVARSPDYGISLVLAEVDLNGIKTLTSAAVSVENVYLSLTSSFVMDIYGNGIIPVAPTSPIQASILVLDVTPPRVVEFTLDLNSGVIYLTFDEPIDSLNFTPAGIKLLNSTSSDSPQSFTLTGGTYLFNESRVPTLRLQLTQRDRDAVAILNSLATSVSNTYIHLDSGTVRDLAGNLITALQLRASSVFPNTSPPYLLYFDLNLATNLLRLKFSQPIVPRSFNAASVTLLASAFSPDNLTISTLSSVTFSESNTLVQVTIVIADQYILKSSDTAVAKSVNSTYISITSSAATNYASLGVEPISSSNPMAIRYLQGAAVNTSNVACTDGDILLVRGSGGPMGTVEMCYNNTYGTICDDAWDTADAVAVCRFLGYQGRTIAYRGAYFGTGFGPVLLSGLTCSGSESSLLECPRGNRVLGSTSCVHSHDAGVYCASVCTNGEIRFVGNGSASNQGTVQICNNNVFGTVCSTGWDINEAIVVCRQLGFGGTSIPYSNAAFGWGFGNMSLSNFNCNGSESLLASCPFDEETTGCDHNIEAGVSCSSACATGDMRLVGGAGRGQGRVEVCYNGSYGTICDDDWDALDAVVVCSFLGFRGNVTAYSSAFFGEGIGPTLLSGLKCSGSEPSLLECPHNTSDIGNTSCTHRQDAGVYCALGCTTGDIRLVGGSGRMEGTVEICYNNTYGTVCGDTWDMADAAVVCNYLGYKGASRAYQGAFYGEGSGPILLSGVDCAGSEPYLLACPRLNSDIGYTSCTHSQDAGVYCASEVATGSASTDHPTISTVTTISTSSTGVDDRVLSVITNSVFGIGIGIGFGFAVLFACLLTILCLLIKMCSRRKSRVITTASGIPESRKNKNQSLFAEMELVRMESVLALPHTFKNESALQATQN